MTALTSQSLLTDVETAIQKILAGAIQEYYIGGKRITYMNIKELMDIRDSLKAAVGLEDATNGNLEAQVVFG